MSNDIYYEFMKKSDECSSLRWKRQAKFGSLKVLVEQIVNLERILGSGRIGSINIGLKGEELSSSDLGLRFDDFSELFLDDDLRHKLQKKQYDLLSILQQEIEEIKAEEDTTTIVLREKKYEKLAIAAFNKEE